MSYVGNCQFWSVPIGFPGGQWTVGFTNGAQTQYGLNQGANQVSVQPDGTLGQAPSGRNGPWETHTDHPSFNAWVYNVNGVHYLVLFRGA